MLITFFFIAGVFTSSTVKSTLNLPSVNGLMSDGTTNLVWTRVPLCDGSLIRAPSARFPERQAVASRFVCIASRDARVRRAIPPCFAARRTRAAREFLYLFECLRI